MKEWLQKKLIESENLEAKIKVLRERGTIATINGSFDLLHVGHLVILYEASKQADFLIVLLNSDQSIQRYKSKNRPINPLQERLEMIAALEFVNFVSFFHETDPRAVLSRIAPDVHVNGAEYRNHCIEEEVVRHFGGKVHFVEKIPGFSSTNLLKKVKQCV